MKYIALTFGPISRLSSSVQSTKGLWASSYFFSYLAKSIIAPFRKRRFVLPIVDDDLLWQTDLGIGRFPDRYIFQSEEGDFERLKKQANEIRKQISLNIFDFFDGEYEKDNIETFIDHYIKIYAFEKECTTSNIAVECESVLDLMEMQDTFNLEESANYLSLMFDSKQLFRSFLAQAAFMKTNQRQLFDSLDEIAERECLNKIADTKKPYHNYIAIIKADGDNLGKTIKELLEKGKTVLDLSRILLDFGEKAIPIIHQYEARLIFLGGDDLLIFAPIKYKKSVFSLIKNLNQVFDNSMEELDFKPTLSFGLSVTYFKFPMGEALELAECLLNEAKKEKLHPQKNTLAFNVQKHSGQSFGTHLEKNTDTYRKFLELIDAYTVNDEDLVNSVMHWLRNNEAILKIILKLQGAEREQRLKNYFENSFNEDVHNPIRSFFIKVQELLIQAYDDFRSEQTEETKSHEEKSVDAISKLYTALRFIHFINNKRDE